MGPSVGLCEGGRGTVHSIGRMPEPPRIPIVDLGRMSYAEAYQEQLRHHAEVLVARDSGLPVPGRLLFVEHNPVITVTKRPDAPGHVLAGSEALAAAGVAIEATDRGGDVTYHGPGQIVCYPIIDLRAVGLRLHDHMRLMERAVIETLAGFGLPAKRDEGATGVWIPPGHGGPHPVDAKICAMGVRVRRWITLHGLALNVEPDLSHFGLIVPCGLHGRPVTSLKEQLCEGSPPIGRVRESLGQHLQALLGERMAAAGG